MANKDLMQKILGMFQKPEAVGEEMAVSPNLRSLETDGRGATAELSSDVPMPARWTTQPDLDGYYRAKDPITGESMGSEPTVESYRDGETVPFRIKPLKKAAPKVSGVEVQKEKVKLLRNPGKLVKRLMGPEE
jgi:hypothetical protein